MSLEDVAKNISLLNSEVVYRVIVFVSIVVVGVVISIIIRRTFLKFLSARTSKAIASNVSRAIYYVLLFTVVVVALGITGIDVTGFALAGGFAGIVIGVALQPLLSNLFAGLYLMIEKTINVGEIVEVANNAGEVTEVSPIFTRIRTFDGIIISVANTQIISGVTKNFSKAVARRIEFKLSISYKDDAEKAYRIIKNVLDEHPYVLVNPAPDIFVSNLDQSGIEITVRVWTPPQVAYDTMKDLLWRMKKALSDAGIEIPFPQIDVWFRNTLNIE
ncbi:MAG: mechanosensitive ion channel family protein [Ignisphaera sp.]|uniref:Mechanosensitive ion channel family protein n=1 Tax=Ignisphaera aggregans TaxID=334771 RepID=A0A7J3MZV3_9CREN